MKKRLLVILLCMSGWSFAQQDKQFTHFMFDRMSYNPATTGFRGYCGTVIYRNQWDRVQDAPNTTLFNFQGNLQGLYLGPGKLGVGLSFHNDAIGFQRNNTVNLNAAYHVGTVFGTVSAGLGIGLLNVGYSPNWVPPQVPAPYDPSIPPGFSQSGFDQNIGLYWNYNGAHVGISSTHLMPAELGLISYSVERHYYVQAGYKFQQNVRLLGQQRSLDLKPAVLVKADGVSAIFDLNIIADLSLGNAVNVWAGLTYRYVDGVGLMAGFGKDNLKVGYSFDVMTNALTVHGKGSHELMLSYCIFPPKPSITRFGLPNILQ